MSAEQPKWLQSSYDMGAEAYRNGDKRESCPYSNRVHYGSRMVCGWTLARRRVWHEGYDDAEKAAAAQMDMQLEV